MAPRVRLGELLVEAQIITREELDEVLTLQKQDGRRLGTLLVETGLVTETQVTQILSQQLSVPWVSLHHIDFSRQLLNLVQQELAERHCLVPIFVRRVRGQGDTLYVAMDDPSDEAALRDISHYSGLPVRAMIAPPSDIRSAIRVYYAGSVAPAGEQRAAEPPTARPPAQKSPPAATNLATEPLTEAATAPSSSPSVPKLRVSSIPPVEAIPPPPDSSPQIEAREITMPVPKRRRGPRMVTLTLLDGTKVNLPAREPPKQPSDKPSRPPGDGNELTARDLVAALRAVAHGADASEILGENVRWEGAFAALLSLLLKKQIIADWEFVEEYKKL